MKTNEYAIFGAIAFIACCAVYLSSTGTDSIFYIGYAMGCVVSIVLISVIKIFKDVFSGD